MTYQQKLLLGHGFFLVLFATLFWWSFVDLLARPSGMEFVQALGFGSLVFSWVLIGFLLWQRSSIFLGGMAALIVPLFFFLGFDWRALLVLLFVGGCFFIALRKTRSEMADRLVFSPRRYFDVARGTSVLGFVLLLSLGYFLSIRTWSWEDLMSHFQLQTGTVEHMMSLVKYVEPKFSVFSGGSQTVDEYLRSVGRMSFVNVGSDESREASQLASTLSRLQQQGIPIEVSGGTLGILEAQGTEALVSSGRQAIEQQVGRSVAGNELIAPVLAEMVQKKIITWVRDGSIQKWIPDQSLPLFVSLLFLLMLWPVGLFVFSFWKWLAAGIVQIFCLLHWVEIKGHTVIQERMEW